MELGLNGKVAIVTGGSQGIGRAAATRMAAEGARVAICARRPDVLDEAAEGIKKKVGSDVIAVFADVTQQDQIEHLFETVVEAHGRLDILVNNAGTSSSGPFLEGSNEKWHADLDLKLFGAIRCTRLAIPHMRAVSGGRIINVTSAGGKQPGAGSTPTSVSRAAGIALTKALSKEYATDNILVNTVCLGILKAEQHDRLWHAERASEPELDRDEFYRRWALEDRIALGRAGEAEEAGDVIAFLASERASYVTGVAINIDGGQSAVV
ncbi:MAG: SDR family oxidoreductase [Pirellulaceae bacterium]|nr:SDR family oxidoreductase [Pirellulaceae bacterium]